MKTIILALFLILGSTGLNKAMAQQDLNGGETCGTDGTGCTDDKNNNGIPDCDEGQRVVDAARRDIPVSAEASEIEAGTRVHGGS